MSSLGRLVCDEWGTVNDSRECPPPTPGKVLKVPPHDSQRTIFTSERHKLQEGVLFPAVFLNIKINLITLYS